MHRKSTFLLFIILSFSSLSAQNLHNLWQDLGPTEYELMPSFQGIPSQYRATSLDENLLLMALDQVPLENIGAQRFEGKRFFLPMPDGTNQYFQIVESPIMEAGLASRFPLIKTYLGKGIDDPRSVLRFSYSPKGFQAIIHSPTGTIYMDPYPAVNQTVYFSYYKKDYKPLQFFAEASLPQDPGSGNTGPILQRGTGQNLKSYRIAIAATGEYTSFHGGTVSSAMNAIVNTLNRVNSVYERDFSIRLILVANNDRIVYLDGTTDPYTNNDASLLLSENQNNIDAEIGSSNYDIGHIFATQGSGLASPAVVCHPSFKAQGTTGISSPVGDPFDIDYVAHEIGHQFGAAHTFNSRVGSCQGNRVSSAAYEPGSGSTIMAYAGICSFDNLQNRSHDYFHNHSYIEIINFVTNRGGNTCGTTMASGNTPPAVGINLGAITVPMMTPFELLGGAMDVDGDSLTYCWEQYDRGPSGSPNSPAGDAPIFRSYPPQPNPLRIFPRLEDLIENTTSLGEILPTYRRTLHFRMTVRDNHPGSGGVEYANTQFEVTNLAGPFQVTIPNIQATIRGNGVVPVSWDVANTDQLPVSCDSVSVHLSIDGGFTYPILLARSVANNGIAMIRFPNLDTDSARIKIKARNNIFFDISDENSIIFKVADGIDPELLGLDFQLYPNPVQDELFLNLRSEENQQIEFEILDLQGKSLVHLEQKLWAGNDFSHQLQVAHLARGMYLYRIRYKENVFGGKITLN